MSNVTLGRGEHILPHQCQILGRDLHAEQIAHSFGGTAHGYRLTAIQLEDRRSGRAAQMPYEYLIYSPRSFGTSWTAFYTEQDLRVWLAAYGCTVARPPAPGESFTVHLPADESAFQQLVSVPLAVGDRVRITDHYRWCGNDTFGEVGTVERVYTYPADVVEGDALVMVRREWGAPVPLLPGQVERIAPSFACSTCGEQITDAEARQVASDRDFVEHGADWHAISIAPTVEWFAFTREAVSS